MMNSALKNKLRGILPIVIVLIAICTTFFGLKSYGTEIVPEDQILLKSAGTERTEEKPADGQKLIFSLGVVVVLVGMGYYAVRRFAYKSQAGKSNMQIKVLSQHYMGPKKSLAIIRVAGESILIGVTDHNISMIKSLAMLDDELPQVLPTDFKSSMTEVNLEGDADDYSFQGLKSNVSEKMKSMKNIQ